MAAWCVVGVEVGPDGALSVELQKTTAGLGFSLDGGKASAHGDRPLYIKRIFRGECSTQTFKDVHQGETEDVIYASRESLALAHP